MVEIVNLKRARKVRAKAEAQATAAENRVVHGRSKEQRAAGKAERDRLSRLLDGAKRDD